MLTKQAMPWSPWSSKSIAIRKIFAAFFKYLLCSFSAQTYRSKLDQQFRFYPKVSHTFSCNRWGTFAPIHHKQPKQNDSWPIMEFPRYWLYSSFPIRLKLRDLLFPSPTTFSFCFSIRILTHRIIHTFG